MRSGDRIVEVNGVAVGNFQELRDAVSPLAEVRVKVVVEREGERVELSLVPEKLEERNPVETRTRGIIGVEPLFRAPVIGVADPASPAARAGLQTFDRVTHVDGRAVTTYDEAERAIGAAEGRAVAVRALRETPLATPGLYTQRPVEATLGPCGRACGIEHAEMYVHAVAKGSPAAAAGLQRGDKLVAVNGAPLEAWTSFDAFRQNDVKAALALALVRGGERVEATVTQRVIEVRDELKQPQPQVLFGAYNDGRSSSRIEAERTTHRYAPGKALVLSVMEAWNSIRITVLGLWMLATAQLSFDNLGGPLMLFDIASRSAEAGWKAFLSVLALISVNLGVFNLVPLPVLDGFHVLSAAVEAVRKRPLSLRAREIANMVGLFLLVTLMVLATRNDLIKWLTD
jgi:regulator of sigma E protease